MPSCRNCSTKVDVTMPKLTKEQRHNGTGRLQEGVNQEDVVVVCLLLLLFFLVCFLCAF